MDSKELELIFKLYKDMDSIVHEKVSTSTQGRQHYKYRSEQIDQLAAALSVAQGKYKKLYYNRINPSSLDPYVDIEAIFDATREPLTVNQLAVVQLPLTAQEGTSVVTWLMHSSGQFIECSSRVTLIAGDMKLFSSVVNEVKKQHLLGLLGIAPTKIEDDDCLEETKHRRVETDKGTAISYNYGEDLPANYERLSKAELKELDYHLTEDLKDIYRDILKTYKIQHLGDLPQNKYRIVLDKVLNIKNKRRTGK